MNDWYKIAVEEERLKLLSSLDNETQLIKEASWSGFLKTIPVWIIAAVLALNHGGNKETVKEQISEKYQLNVNQYAILDQSISNSSTVESILEAIRQDKENKSIEALTPQLPPQLQLTQTKETNKAPNIHQSHDTVDFSKLIYMIGQKETGHIRDPEKRNRAIGDHGDAIGKYQIHSEVITDVNTHCGGHYIHAEMVDPVKSEEVLKKYLEYWGKEYTQNTGRAPTYQVLARIWNGGPTGYKKSATNGYWQDAKQYLKATPKKPQGVQD